MDNYECRHFLSYRGIKLPLNLVSPLGAGEENNRNTFYRGYFDKQDKLMVCQKVVYGEVELAHHYSYYDNGILSQAEIIEEDEEAMIIKYDRSGVQLR